MCNNVENSKKRLDAAVSIIECLEGLGLNEEEMLDSLSLAQLVLTTEYNKDKGCCECTCLACLACEDDEDEFDEFEEDDDEDYEEDSE